MARYGKRLPPSGLADPARVGGLAAVFQKDGCHYEVFLSNGVVECESIRKMDTSLFSVEERDKIVKMESADGNWAKPVTEHGQLIWTRSDGAIICCYPANTPLIFAMSKNYLELAAEAKKKSLGFPSEAEAKKYIVPGMNEEDVIKKFGIPPIRMPSGSDGEVLTYTEPPTRNMVDGYAGFEVVVKKGKVTDLEIIHASVRNVK